MPRPQAHVATVVLKLLLPLALGIAFLAAVYLRFYSGLLKVADLPVWPAYAGYFVLSAALWAALETRSGLIYRCFEQPLGRWLWSLAGLELVTLALVSLAAFFWRGYSFSRFTVCLFWALHFGLCGAAALAVRAWVRRQTAASWIFLIGESIELETVRRECLVEGAEARWRQFTGADEAIEALEAFQPPVDCSEVLVVAVPSAGLERLGRALERLPVPASLAVYGLSPGEVHATRSFVVLSTNPPAAAAFDYVFSKRLIDILISATGLLLLAPLLGFIAAVIRMRSGRPVLLVQQRVGRGGRRFSLRKFRTLPVSSLTDHDRQWTPPSTDGWGRFLRSTGLDELPQLFNVLRGDMSLVGPRPERPHFVDQFRRQLPFYSTRHRFQVGITGWAQVHGWRGDTSIPRRVEHDLYYLRHWSLALDFRILWMTLADFFHRLWPGTVPVVAGAASGPANECPMALRATVGDEDAEGPLLSRSRPSGRLEALPETRQAGPEARPTFSTEQQGKTSHAGSV